MSGPRLPGRSEARRWLPPTSAPPRSTSGYLAWRWDLACRGVCDEHHDGIRGLPAYNASLAVVLSSSRAIVPSRFGKRHGGWPGAAARRSSARPTLRIEYVGTASDADAPDLTGDESAIVDYGHASILPGLIDSHVHLTFGVDAIDESAPATGGFAHLRDRIERDDDADRTRAQLAPPPPRLAWV